MSDANNVNAANADRVEYQRRGQVTQEEYVAALEKELFDSVKRIVESHGSPQAVTVVAGIVRDFKRIYKFIRDAEGVVGIKTALWTWMKYYDAELGK